MNITIKDIVEAQEVLGRISQNNNLPMRTAFKIYNTVDKLTSALNFFEKKRKDLFLRYGKEEGENYVIPAENSEVFYAEMNELLQTSCCEDAEKIDVSLDIDLGVSPAEIALLTPFINFVE